MILRTFAYEVELSGNYNIELNDEYAIAVGISNLKQELHESGTTEKARALRQWLIEFMKARIDEGKSWDVFRAPAGNTQDTNLYSFAERDGQAQYRQAHRIPRRQEQNQRFQISITKINSAQQ